MPHENIHSVSAMKRVTVCASIDEPGEHAALDAWLAKWSGSLAYLSPNEGCGCCVDTYRIEGPSDAIAELPKNLIANDSDWQ
jgi:hypothetical protein